MNPIEKLIELDTNANEFGFSWESGQQILEQIQSECIEVSAHLNDENKNSLQEEIGDLLHATITLCLFYKLNPTETLEKSVNKFGERLARVKSLAQQQGLEQLTDQPFSKLMALWNEAKDAKK